MWYLKRGKVFGSSPFPFDIVVAMADALITPAGRTLLRALMPQERRVVVLVCAGLANVVIAERIGTTEQVVKNYLPNIFVKAGAYTRTEFILFAFKHGTVVCPCQSRFIMKTALPGSEGQCREAD
jgi:DNA-binding NarL/FixJ family response regulator